MAVGSNYQDFLMTKRRVYAGDGLASVPELPHQLYPWQASIVRWALRKGRACIFADCGLGKTYMQLAWAQALQARTLILAPLCVADQTVAQGADLGIPVTYAATSAESPPVGITITNYERIDRFNPRGYDAVVLDESSILKAFDGKTRTKLIAAFHETRYRLCCTATPSPNDIAELANHAEFMGLMTRPEFLATWFVHDDEGWRMKRHATAPFFRWLASWAVALQTPSDIGGDDTGFILPPLHIRDEVIAMNQPVSGSLFPELAAKGIGGRLKARRASLSDRVERAQKLVSDGEQWIIWCGLNEESDQVSRALNGESVNVQGSDSHTEKRAAVEGFLDGSIRILVTKPKILGFGMNFQHCHKMAFLGLSDSYESYYQCIRRSWRFGQSHPVDAHVVVSEAEQLVVENVRRKQADAEILMRGLLSQIAEFEREEIASV